MWPFKKRIAPDATQADLIALRDQVAALTLSLQQTQAQLLKLSGAYYGTMGGGRPLKRPTEQPVQSLHDPRLSKAQVRDILAKQGRLRAVPAAQATQYDFDEVTNREEEDS